MWFLIVLSTILFNVAFLVPACAWCILLFPLPLWWWLRGVASPGWRCSITAGSLWGGLVFGTHFVWLLVMMLQHTHAPVWLCCLSYLGVSGYATATAVGWFVVMVVLYRLLLLKSIVRQSPLVVSVGRSFDTRASRAPRTSGQRIEPCGRSMSAALALLVSTAAYWLFLEYWFLRLLLIDDGYPLLSPFIPLVQYRWFCWLVGWVGCLLHGPLAGPTGVGASASLPAIVYCAPVTNRVVHADAPWRTNASQVGYKLYEQLCARPLAANGNMTLVVSPESTFCFPLNHHQDLVRLWSSALPPQAHCLMGSVWQDDRQWCQAWFWLHKGLINKIYVKKYPAPFVERMPSAWKAVGPLKEAFVGKCVEFSPTANTQASCDAFYITPQLCVVPRICSEFFLHDSASDFDRYRSSTMTVLIAVAVNDSWFVPFFRRLLYNLTILKAAVMQQPVVYVGHFGAQIIEP